MSSIRVFIAIEIPEKIKKEIAEQTAAMRRISDRSVRWVPAENLHLTIRFLGEIPPAKLDQLTQALETESGQHRPFEINVEGLGAFPNPHRPRVIWIGVETGPQLDSLAQRIETTVRNLGYPGEEKPFTAHLTIGRVRDGNSSAQAQSLQQALERTKIGRLGTFAVENIQLLRSDLQSGGPVYTRLFTAALGGRPVHEVKSESA